MYKYSTVLYQKIKVYYESTESEHHASEICISMLNLLQSILLAFMSNVDNLYNPLKQR